MWGGATRSLAAAGMALGAALAMVLALASTGGAASQDPGSDTTPAIGTDIGPEPASGTDSTTGQSGAEPATGTETAGAEKPGGETEPASETEPAGDDAPPAGEDGSEIEPRAGDTGAEPGAASSSGTDGVVVPCEVAMVVGCVATIDGGDGPTTVTLEVAGAGGTGSGTDGDDPALETAAGIGTDGAAEQEGADRPLKSGVDPWERGGLRSNFGTESIPLSNYQIGADVTGWLGVPDPLDSFIASQTNWAFTTTTFLVILATNALQWAFDFPLAEDLIGDAGVLAQTYTVDFFGLGLTTSVYGLALTVTMTVAGFKAVTRGVVAAGGEVLLAVSAYVVLMVLTLTAGFGDVGLSVARLSSDLSGSIAGFAAGQERQEECATRLEPQSVAGVETDTTIPPTGGATGTAGGSSACSFGFAIQRSLVELPYQNLQWGQVLDGVPGKEPCAAINLELLRDGPWGNSDEPRDRMRAEPSCEENADFNHQATYIRLGIASANTVASAAVTLLVLVVCAMLLWQQLKLLFLTVTMPHALVFAILPGRSRRVAWQWVEHLLGVVIRTAILALGLVVWLSLFSLIVYEQLTVRGIFLSFFASMAMAVSGFYGLYRLTSTTRRLNPMADRGPGAGDRSGGRGRDGDGERGGRAPERRSAGAAIQHAHSTFRSVRPRPERRTGGPTGSAPSTSRPRDPGGTRQRDAGGSRQRDEVLAR